VNDLEKAGGISELYHCLQMVPFLDEDKLLYYLELYGKQFLYQKAGFILEPLKEDLKLTEQFFDKCREYMGKSRRYFSDTMERQTMEYVSAWQMYVPKNFKRMAELEE
jgi:predicted transcriptional regulator of viral defense system